jgi:tRNA modification GTPase
MKDTIVALATPIGIGAIGVIRLSGSEAISIAQSVFSKNITEQASHTLHFGKIVDKRNESAEIVLDEVVLSIFKGPHSYTGENVIEISCHGSPYIQQKIIELLIEKGCRNAKAGEFTLRAYLNGKLDLAQAEAVADLIASDSEMAHRMAIDQMRGGFSTKIKELRQQLIDFASLIELELDFGEEDVEFANRDHLFALVQEISKYVNTLKESFTLGNVLKNGIATVIAGKPNAGKSTVLNALLQEERAIVSSIAGTTRDTIEEAISIGGVLYRFIDTAGIRQHADEIEEIGIGKTFEKLNKADLIIYIFDAQSTSPEELQQELENLKTGNKPIIAVANKTDLMDLSALKIKFERLPQTVFVSGKQGEINELLLVLQTKAAELNQSSQTLVNNNRHFEALHKSSLALDDVMKGLTTSLSSDFIALDIRKALFHLGEITGQVSSEDLLANIFSRFCIGK